MINYKYKDLFLKSHIDKQLKIAADDGSFTATNSDIHVEDFELTESLCSDSELRFGSCEASVVKFQIRNAFIPLAGKWLTVTETLDGNADVPFQYGRYKVFSDKPTADREYRDIVAYDAMYDILGADVTAWYNSILPNKDSTVTLKQFRESFIACFDLDEVAPEDGLANDTMAVERTIAPEQISGKDVITAICEINGCFGHIGRDGKFYYIYLPQGIEGLYPANDLFPRNNLYPRDPKGYRISSGAYIKVEYEDYTVEPITKLQIRQQENDIGKIWPETPVTADDNSYIIQDNFLVYGKSSEQLSVIAENIFRKISGITYIPLKKCEAIGNPCFEVGDAIRLNAKNKLIETYILSRTLKGIQSLRDNYVANGEKRRAEKLNGVQKSIIQLKGKSNVLERTIEETRLEMKDIEAGLSTEISITAAGIRSEVAQTYETKTNASSEYTSIKSSITQNANSITAEVTRASTAEGNLSSRIAITENGLSSKVTKGNISSEISQEAGKISIKSDRISIDSTYFKLTESGEITATSGKIADFSISATAIKNGKTSLLSSAKGVYIGTDGISVGGNGYGLAAFSVSADGKVTLYSSGGGIEINSNNAINFYPLSGDVSLRYRSISVMEFTGTSLPYTKAKFHSGYTILGEASGRIGFFGDDGSTKKNIAKISSPSSATASSVATTVNNLIDALKAYNLIG